MKELMQIFLEAWYPNQDPDTIMDAELEDDSSVAEDGLTSTNYLTNIDGPFLEKLLLKHVKTSCPCAFRTPRSVRGLLTAGA